MKLQSDLIIPTESQAKCKKYDLLMRNLGYYRGLDQRYGVVYRRRPHVEPVNLNIVPLELTFKGIKRR